MRIPPRIESGLRFTLLSLEAVLRNSLLDPRLVSLFLFIITPFMFPSTPNSPLRRRGSHRMNATGGGHASSDGINTCQYITKKFTLPLSTIIAALNTTANHLNHALIILTDFFLIPIHDIAQSIIRSTCKSLQFGGLLDSLNAFRQRIKIILLFQHVTFKTGGRIVYLLTIIRKPQLLDILPILTTGILRCRGNAIAEAFKGVRLFSDTKGGDRRARAIGGQDRVKTCSLQIGNLTLMCRVRQCHGFRPTGFTCL